MLNETSMALNQSKNTVTFQSNYVQTLGVLTGLEVILAIVNVI